MEKLKKIVSLSLSLSLVTAFFAGTYGNSVTALEITKQKKISSVLLEEMETLKKNETVPVYVELDDINQKTVEAKADKQTGMTLAELEAIDKKLLKSDELKNASNEELETLLPKYFKDTETEREYVQGLVNERIMAERKIAKEMYDKQNSDYVEKTGIDETEVQFVSSYSPMVITECTEDEIDDIVVQGKVKSIDIREDVEVQIDDTNNTNEVKAQAASADTTTYAWKTAICADKTTDTIGIKGKGVTVGVFDFNTVNKNHAQLKNTDITVLDKVTFYDDYHGTDVTRVLAGSQGIVPKAKVYTNHKSSSSNSYTSYAAEIEELLNKNVSIINMSISFSRDSDDYYTQFEKWLDHISFMHNVLIVKSSGNQSTYKTEQCPIGALAYNVLTVGGLNTKNTDTFSDDKFHSGSCFGNGSSKGCAKPECIAAFNDVLEKNMGGTSFAAPAVAGVCAQVIQTDPYLAFEPEIVKAIIMASCDRKGSEDYAKGLTAKEGSGVVNAFKAIVIASTERYEFVRTFPHTGSKITEIDFVKRGNTSKIAVCWETHSRISKDDHSDPYDADSSGSFNYDLEVYSSNGNLLKESTVYNSSSEVVVFNSENDKLDIYCCHYYESSNTYYEIGIAWY